MSGTSRFARVFVVALFALALTHGSASASRNQFTTFEAPAELQDPATRAGALDQLESLGVHSLRVLIYWSQVAPRANSRIEPDIDPTDPAAYDWSHVDPIFDAAARRGWPIILTITGPVPKWATRARTDNVTRPDPNKFAQFMTAAGRHFADEVAFWSIWNEPNHPAFLQPQYDSHHRPLSPAIYRALFLAAQKGLRAAKVKRPQLLFGETAPTGTGKDVAPLAFLRGALCLTASYNKTSAPCAKLHFAGYAHHPYTPKAGPNLTHTRPDNVFIGVLARLTSALDKAARAGAIDRARPLFLTEFGIQSVPDTLSGVDLQTQADYRSISERIAYENPRVKSFSQYLLKDDTALGGFQSGLLTAAGKQKPSYDGFRLALSARKQTSSTVSVWGKVRPATAPGTATLQYRSGTRRTFRTLQTLTYNRLGYFTVTAPYTKGREYRLAWTTPAGSEYLGATTRAYDY